VYKLLLCWRYLRTRYLAMVCIVSVMLGVATLIVVNSVMTGFSSKLRDRLHGLLSDIVVESPGYEGFSNPQGLMNFIRQDKFLDEQIVAMAPQMEIFAMMQATDRNGGRSVLRSVHIIGIDPKSRSAVGGFAEHMVLREGHPSFALTEEGKKRQHELHPTQGHVAAAPPPPPLKPGEKPPPDPPPSAPFVPAGIIMGYAIAHHRDPEAKPDEQRKDIRDLGPGDDVILTTIGGQGLNPVYQRFAVADYIRTEMSEYDNNIVFVPLEHLQRLRTMDNRATSLQIRLKDYRQAPVVIDHLRALCPTLRISTWEDKQGALLAAIRVEKGILNVLLFLIVGVAGFGILAIFSMIVVEKTRDIGILKALGASNGGVLRIFLGYGLLLGLVGAALGTALGVALTNYINEIEMFLAHVTGMEIFPRGVYYFDRIPTDIQTWSVALVNLGAVAIAVVFSILPALRAALLHPVQALRYE
jgi:lipoprotein-releasing system permease protein